MATKETLYKYHAHETLESGKDRHLFTNDTVSRTKTLLKNGVNMDSVRWIALEQPMTKAQVMNLPASDQETAEPSQAVA